MWGVSQPGPVKPPLCSFQVAQPQIVFPSRLHSPRLPGQLCSSSSALLTQGLLRERSPASLLPTPNATPAPTSLGTGSPVIAGGSA